jgi:hypothetical protein
MRTTPSVNDYILISIFLFIISVFGITICLCNYINSDSSNVQPITIQTNHSESNNIQDIENGLTHITIPYTGTFLPINCDVVIETNPSKTNITNVFQ